jgi:hypothetical protein
MVGKKIESKIRRRNLVIKVRSPILLICMYANNSLDSFYFSKYKRKEEFDEKQEEKKKNQRIQNTNHEFLNI